MIPNTSSIQPTASDIGQRIFLIIVLIVLNGALFIKLYKKAITSYQQPIGLLLLGLSLITIAILCNSIMAGRWDLNYITAFLTLVTLSPVVVIRGLAVAGYILLSFAITAGISVTLNRTMEGSGKKP